MSTDYDIAVVGAGVAGLTAARVAAEAGRRVIAYDRLSPGGQLVNLTTVHDYPEPGGSAESWGLISELVARAEAAGVTMSFDEVTRVHGGTPVRLETAGGDVSLRVAVWVQAARKQTRMEESARLICPPRGGRAGRLP